MPTTTEPTSAWRWMAAFCAILGAALGATAYLSADDQPQPAPVAASVPVNPFTKASGAASESSANPDRSAEAEDAAPATLDDLVRDPDPATRDEAATLQGLLAEESAQ